MNDLVWYVAYGSNLASERFRCYLAGGRPIGARRGYLGCRDTRPPRASRAVELPGGIHFALRSRVWGGGMAFYDPDLPGRAAAHAYLLSRGQFADVLAQEMHRPVGEDVDLTEVLGSGRQVLGPGPYETLLHVGSATGIPMLTFTAPWGSSEVESSAPTAEYLTMLGRGLHESQRWSLPRIGRYLAERPGAQGIWTSEGVAALLRRRGHARPRITSHGSSEPEVHGIVTRSRDVTVSDRTGASPSSLNGTAP